MDTASWAAHPRDESEVPKPFGYWLKHIHNGLEGNLAAAVGELGLDRRSWQILNTVAHGPIDAAAVVDALAPFAEDDVAIESHLAVLARRGVVATDASGRYALTDAGAELHAEASDRVHAARLAIMRGFSEAEFRTLLELLRRVAANVDACAAQEE
ncbi:hypothetical protein AB0L57_07860 [Nocardia sp. NPDC052254]|uniref:hypothetical protein n=1 Tax=Nocardia sp. NPDC052254 TaxID=3155681 RepID=UPI00343FCA20